MKKLISIVSVLLFLISIISIFPVSAENLSGVEVNDNNFNPYFDFDSIPKTYNEGTIKKSYDGSLKVDNANIFWDPVIKNGAGVKGNALTLHIHDVTNSFCCLTFLPSGKNPKTDFSADTDFMFYIDTSKDLQTDGTYRERTVKIVIQETDVLPDGSLNTKVATAWNPIDGVYYYWKDGKWVSHETGDGSDYSTNAAGKEWIKLPAQYKGWIRVPFSSLKHAPAYEPMTDSDGKFNGNEIEEVVLGFGLWDKSNGADIVVDQVGFYKNTGTPATSGSNTTPTTTKPGAKTTTTVGGSVGTTNPQGSVASDTSSLDSMIDSSIDSTDSSEIDSSLPSESGSITSKTTLNTSSKDVVTKPTNKKFNPLVIIIPAIVLLLAGGGVAAYFFIYKKKKTENTDKTE